MGDTPAPRRVPMKPAPGRTGRRGLGLVCALAFSVLWPGAAATGELAWGDVATPLRIVTVPHWPFPNDGLVIRGSVKLPTGDEASPAGSGGHSASIWAETSGALPGSASTRSWLYSASLGVLAGEAPRGLPDHGSRFVAFGP